MADDKNEAPESPEQQEEPEAAEPKEDNQKTSEDASEGEAVGTELGESPAASEQDSKSPKDAPAAPPEPEGEAYITFKGVKTGYGAMEVLHGIDMTVREGEIVTLIGANGAGKSTTLMTLSKINKIWSGDITFKGESLNDLKPHEVVARGIVQVPEGRQIFPDLTVLENLKMGAFLRDDEDGIAADLQRCFEIFPILESRSTQLGGTLSGGEQQMLAIARALMARPKVLLLDEPSLGLAPLIIKQIFEIVEDLNRSSGTTVFIVEQNAKAALKLAHRGYVMETGRIVLSGKADDLIEDKRVQEAFLGE